MSAQPPFRARIVPGVRRRLTRVAARAPVRLRSSKQLAREACELGAIQKVSELAPLLRLVRERAPLVTVEIGTAGGGALYAFCQSVPCDGLLVSIDLPGGEFGGGYGEEDIPRMRKRSRRGQELEFLRLDSHLEDTRRALATILDGRPVDFLFIDGDHSYEGVRSDFELYASLARPGGLVAFHDILPHPRVPDCEVDRFWAEVKPRYRHWEFLDPGDVRGWGQWGGIGVLELDAPLTRL